MALSEEITCEEAASQAAMAGCPVTVTVNIVGRFQVQGSLLKTKITVASAVLHCVLNVSRLYFGVSYFKDCPQQPNIPNYLLGLVLISLLTHPLFTTAFGRRSRHPPQPPSCFKSCLKCLLSLVGITWLLAGMETFSKKDTAKLFDFEETKYNVMCGSSQSTSPTMPQQQ
ncbi:uncharacterized protein LOC142889540 isoform X4 [Nelusetta ayraudi]|uniref:uncharacterized protein LOC142889540 isoform X4 n=1 Tax=Nelusetta ayraudi TaxID=303726 RepID=UPI003F6F9210